ncbi:hypothetical protein BDQ17DRAFT_1393600 [Cyathus striatus]|nr:hypothetical protein BDQ17DRAFT_1393600 [Cyathus striatus]
MDFANGKKYVKTIIVLGGSYGDVYVMPPPTVLPRHQHKAFIPYTNVFRLDTTNALHIFLHAQVTSIQSTHIMLSKSFPEYGISMTLPFDYAVCTLESHMPTPLHLWGTHPEVDIGNVNEENNYGRTRKEAVEWLKKRHTVIELSDTMLVVSGGALGIHIRQIEFATDIKAIYLAKRVKLLHSFDRLLPRFDVQMHLVGIETILSEWLNLLSLKNGKVKINTEGKRVVHTEKGKAISADLTLQLGIIKDGEQNESTQYPHIFAIGNAADTFGAIAAGHNVYDQAKVTAHNLIKSAESGVNTKSQEESLEIYTPGLPGIGVSLGLCKAVIQRCSQITHKTDGEANLNALQKWPYFGMHIQKEEDVYL